MAGEITTDAGLNQLAKLFSGQDTAHFAYIALGTGSTGPSAGDTSLEAEVIRKQATVSITNSTVQFKITIDPGEITADIYEIGLFNASSGGVMYYRKVRETPLHFDSDIGAEVVIEISFGRGA